jgi:Ca-activated chloride channel family protein
MVAAAGPCARFRPVFPESRARDIMIAVDTSESMKGLDIRDGRGTVSRFDGAVRFVRAFALRREGDRIGLIAFGGAAVTQCPLTLDTGVALWLLSEVRPEMSGRRTALGDAVALGVARLVEHGGALVVISDGENTAGEVDPIEAARVASARHVRVYTVGIGSGGPVPVPVQLPSGQTVLREKDYPLNEAALRGVAEAAGGRYFRAADVGALADVLSEIDRLEASPAAETRRLPVGRAGMWVALAGAAMLSLLLFSASVLLRTAPLLR